MKFYGIYGRNGCGVYTNPEKIDETMEYLVKPKIKRFSSRKYAENYAIYGFSEYCEKASFIAWLPLNYTVYPNQIERFVNREISDLINILF